MDMEWEGRVRERAYALWEREGQPEGGAERHWIQAEEELRAEEQGRAGAPITEAAGIPADAASTAGTETWPGPGGSVGEEPQARRAHRAMGPVPVHLQEGDMLKHLLATAALVVAFSAPGFAQQQQGQQQPMQPATGGETFLTNQEQGQVRADKVIGNTVRGADDEDIGNINDLVFDEEGRLTAAVIGVGGVLGLGQKDVAVSWDQIDWVPTGEGEEIELVTTLTREQLEQAPEFRNLEAVQAEEEAAAAPGAAPGAAGAPGAAAPGAVPPAQQQ